MKFTPPIDWKETAPTALWALQESYPEIAELSKSTMEQLAAMYSNVPIDEGAQALGQELSHHGYALYDVQTGNDESVFLLIPSDTEPDARLKGISYQDVHYDDDDEEPESAYEVDAVLLLQPKKSWGQKAKRIRSPKLNIRLPSSVLPNWVLDSYQPKEHFYWLNDRLGVLKQQWGKHVYASTEYVSSAIQLVDPSLWFDNLEGVEHMYVATFTHEMKATPIDWHQHKNHPFFPYQEKIHEQNEVILHARPIPFMGKQGRNSALFYQKLWLPVGAFSSPEEDINPDMEGRTHHPALSSQTEVWVKFSQDHEVQTILQLPQIYPPPVAQFPSSDPHIPQLPHSVIASYWIAQVFAAHDGGYYLDGDVSVEMSFILGLSYDERSRKKAYDTFYIDVRILFYYDKKGILQGYLPYSTKEKMRSSDFAWGFAPNILRQSGFDAYLCLKFSKHMQIWRFEDSETAPNFQCVSAHLGQLRGGVCHVAECAGLPPSHKGFLVYGGEHRAWNRSRQQFEDLGFELNIVHLDTGKAWHRSLRGMQPKFDRCRYEQRIHPKPLPHGWILLDIVGDKFGLTDAAWLWHLETDRFFAIPLAAVTDERINADFHYHPDMDCLFVLSNDFDEPTVLERLAPFPEMLAAIENSASLARIVPPWEQSREIKIK